MSEFERTPESMRAELAEIQGKLAELNQQLAELPDGDWEETGSTETAENILKRAGELKRASLGILLALNDMETIQEKLEASALETLELYGDEGMPVFVETIVEDTFGVEFDDTADARLKNIVDQLVEEHGLMTFESAEDTEE